MVFLCRARHFHHSNKFLWERMEGKLRKFSAGERRWFSVTELFWYIFRISTQDAEIFENISYMYTKLHIESLRNGVGQIEELKLNIEWVWNKDTYKYWTKDDLNILIMLEYRTPNLIYKQLYNHHHTLKSLYHLKVRW